MMTGIATVNKDGEGENRCCETDTEVVKKNP